MDRVGTWFGMTGSHGFNIDVYQDGSQFVAVINTYSPSRHRAGSGMPAGAMEFDITEEARADALEALREAVKERISRRCGEIRQFQSQR